MSTDKIGSNLIYQRKLKGYTQEELADKSSVGIRTIQRIEKGDVQPHMHTVKLLAKSLELQLEDLQSIPIIEKPLEKNTLLFLHVSPFFGFIIPFANIFLPLILWSYKAKSNQNYNNHGRAIINFQCSITLYLIISLLAFFPFPGMNFFGTAAVFLFGIIISIKNIFSALSAKPTYFPLSIPFIKKTSTTF